MKVVVNLRAGVVIYLNMHHLSTLLLALGSVTLADANTDNFNPLHHLAGISPYFTPNEPQLDPSVPQGCNVTRAAYLVRHAAIYTNDFDYKSYLEPFIQKLQNATQDGPEQEASRS